MAGLGLILYSLRKMREESREIKEEAQRGKLQNKRDLDSIQIIYQERSSGEHYGHCYVDMGLSSGTLWATCNVGAERAFEIGDYYQWGYTTTEICTKNNTPIGRIPTLQMPKLDMQRDAANANWGGFWRIPAKEDFEELINLCKWELAKCGESVGYSVTGPNGNAVFLPRTGIIQCKSPNFYDDGYYWTCQQRESNDASIAAYCLKLVRIDLHDEHIQLADECKVFSLAVRPVVNLKM